MGKEPNNITSMDQVWRKIPEEARTDWAIERAAEDPLIRGGVEMLLQSRGVDPESIQRCQSALNERLISEYGLTSQHVGAVLIAAERNNSIEWQ